MSEITRIEINDFQSHKHSILKPAPAGQLTVIVGPSDSGKTALLRALRWLFYNVPQGADFIRVGGNAARVTINYADGQRVTRERSRKGFNRYEGGNGRYEGFGNAVPLEVQEITGVRPVQIGDMEFCLNLAEQLDGPFLGKSVSAPAKAKVLGKLAGTEEVDYAAKGVGTDIYRARQEEKRLGDEIARLEEQIKQFDYLPALAERIDALEKLVAAIKTALEQVKVLVDKKCMLERTEVMITSEKAVIRRWQHLDQAENILDRIAAAMNRRMTLSQATAGLAEAEMVITQSREVLAKLARLEEAQVAVNVAETAGAKRRELVSLRVRLDEVQDNWLKTFGVWLKYRELPEAEKVVEDTAKVAERRTSLVRIGGLHHQVVAAEKQCRDTLRKLARVGEAGNYLDSVEALRECQGKVLELTGRLRKVEVEQRRARESAVMWEQKTAELEGAYKDTLLAAARCPVCGSRVMPENLKEVV